MYNSNCYFTDLGLFAADLEMGSTSAMGLIREPPQDDNKATIQNNGTSFSGGEWKFNIGGLPEDNYNNGLHIPIYVIIFGLIGSYIRYLYKTAHLKKAHNAFKKVN